MTSEWSCPSWVANLPSGVASLLCNCPRDSHKCNRCSVLWTVIVKSNLSITLQTLYYTQSHFWVSIYWCQSKGYVLNNMFGIIGLPQSLFNFLDTVLCVFWTIFRLPVYQGNMYQQHMSALACMGCTDEFKGTTVDSLSNRTYNVFQQIDGYNSTLGIWGLPPVEQPWNE